MLEFFIVIHNPSLSLALSKWQILQNNWYGIS